MAIDSQTIAVAADQADLPLYQRIGSFHGHHHDFLLWLIANPSKPQAEGMRKLGLSELTLYSWRRDVAGFKEVIDAVQSYRGDLRSEAAKAMFQSAIVPLSQAMIQVGKGTGRDAQRARERILETVGVLPKPGAEQGEPSVQVNTFTYYLVQPGQEPKPFMVETTARELPPASDAPARLPQDARRQGV